MTGAPVRLGQGIAARLHGQRLPSARGYGMLWSALALGAGVGGGLCLVDRSLAAGAAFAAAIVLWGFAFVVETAPH